jgi:hypothetical protein
MPTIVPCPGCSASWGMHLATPIKIVQSSHRYASISWFEEIGGHRFSKDCALASSVSVSCDRKASEIAARIVTSDWVGSDVPARLISNGRSVSAFSMLCRVSLFPFE